MSMREFQIESQLGEGSFSSVYKVRRITDGLQYAMKMVRMENLNQKQRQSALNEVRILASIRHPNIIGYKEAFIDEFSNSLIIIMEYATGGDLQRKITQFQKTETQFEEAQIWRIFIQIVKGLKVLHGLNIQHRDLKSANIFLTKDGAVKIGDMNVSKISTGLCRTQTGTPYYASPQLWKDHPYDTKSDIWALGCILYQMIALKPPFRAQDMEGLYKKVTRGLYQKIPSNYSQDLSNVVRMMLQVLPQLRPDCEKLLSHISVCQNEIMNKIQAAQVAQTENALLETIRISKNMRFVSDQLPKADYSLLYIQKIRKSQSRNSCLKNPLLPVINKPQQSRKKRYISERKRKNHISMASCESEEQIPLKKNPQSKMGKESLKKKLPPSFSKAVFQLPFITENEVSPKLKSKKVKKSVKSNE